MRRYDAVVFDLFGTLIDNFSRREYERVLAAMADALDIEHGAFARLWSGTFDARAVGTLATVEANIRQCYRALHQEGDAAKIAAAVRIRMDLTERALVPRPCAVETLVALRGAGYKIGLISDCSSEVPQVWPSTPFAPLFDVAIFSCAVGLKKPDPRIYLLACERLATPPQRCLYVGDGSSRELSGAATVGMHAVLLRLAAEDQQDAHRIDAEEWPGQQIAALSGVVDLVRAAVPT